VSYFKEDILIFIGIWNEEPHVHILMRKQKKLAGVVPCNQLASIRAKEHRGGAFGSAMTLRPIARGEGLLDIQSNTH